MSMLLSVCSNIEIKDIRVSIIALVLNPFFDPGLLEIDLLLDIDMMIQMRIQR